MRDDEKFEIERAFDLIPHVVGASWATIWYRLSGIRRPTREEFRDTAARYMDLMEPVFSAYEGCEGFEEISAYVRYRKDAELSRIRRGENPEIEKRYDRYVDYG